MGIRVAGGGLRVSQAAQFGFQLAGAGGFGIGAGGTFDVGAIFGLTAGGIGGALRGFGPEASVALLGIPEYWRFDETDGPRRVKLAGDRLSAEGQYRPIAIERLADGTLQGYSAALDLYLRWEGGQLRWHDPATGRHIVTLEDERARADREQSARIQAEARARELEAELRRMQGR